MPGLSTRHAARTASDGTQCTNDCPAQVQAHRRNRHSVWDVRNLEDAARVALPLTVGLAINDLREHSHRGLCIFASAYLLHMLLGTCRRLWDARTAAADARVNPTIVRTSFWCTAIAVVLASYDWHLFFCCAGLVIPAALMNWADAVRPVSLQGESSLTAGSAPDVDAVHFGLRSLFVLGLAVAALVQYCTLTNTRAGDIVAVSWYVFQFITGLEAVNRAARDHRQARSAPLRAWRRAI